MYFSAHFLKCFSILIAVTTSISFAAPAQEAPATGNAQSSAQSAEQQQIARSMNYMLRRAELTRTLAAQHLEYIMSNRENSKIRLIEDASQVMAFDLICEDDQIDGKSLNQIAADITFRIAMLAGKSTIAPRLTELARKQTVEERMALIGDISTTVLMFEIGRRRGLFDALLTDFGQKRFCAGMRTDMRTRFNEMITSIGD